MKRHFIFQLAIAMLLSSFVNGGCAALQPEPTVTPLSTNTSIPPTKTPTPTVTATVPQLVAPSKGVITIKPPASPKDFSYTGGLLSMHLSALTKEQETKLVENMLDNVPFSSCPQIWIEAVPDSQVPTYALFINSSPDDQNKQFAVLIRSSTPSENRDGSIGMGTIRPETGGKSLWGAAYSPAEGQPIPDELQIQLIFPGCEIHAETVKWPG